MHSTPTKPGCFVHGVLGAVLLGGLGFIGGFFGPMIFAPEANQGPLLGIFITGPLGFVLGGLIGAIVGWWRNRN
jgi:energy-converting hydrogenase Eha subunit B